MDDSFQLNASQQEALKTLRRFADSKKAVALLTGPAGSGKTTLLRAFLAALPERTVRLLAPTGRAAHILADRTGRQASTIHRYLYNLERIVEDKQPDVDQVNLRFEFSSGFNADPDDTLYVIDEASMLSDRKQGDSHLRFGTGRVLSDLLRYVSPEQTDRKIIFVGDPYQLPPVGEGLSPALSPAYWLESFGLRTVSAELTEVVRQKSDSRIYTYASHLRRQLDARTFNPFRISNDVHADKVPRAALAEHYMDEVRQSSYEDVIAITFTNRAAQRYNQSIRTLRYGSGGKELQPGDRLIIVHNNYMHALFNGELAEVKRVGAVVREIGALDQLLLFREVELAREEDERADVKTLLIDNLLHGSEARLSNEQQKLLWDDVGKRLRPRIRKTLETTKVPQLLESWLAAPDESSNKRNYASALKRAYRTLGLPVEQAKWLPFLNNGHAPSGRKSRAPVRRVEQDAFRRLLRQDPYYNALRAKFGYAVTCHKAQGGEWAAAFVDIPGRSPMDPETQTRWTYTAITRASDRLYFLS